MQTSTLKTQLSKLMHIVTVPLLTLFSIGIGLLSWFAFRTTVAYLLAVRSSAGYASAAIHNFSFLLYGIGLLIFSLVIKYYYEAGQKNKTLLKRFIKITMVQGGYFVLILLIRLIF